MLISGGRTCVKVSGAQLAGGLRPSPSFLRVPASNVLFAQCENVLSMSPQVFEQSLFLFFS